MDWYIVGSIIAIALSLGALALSLYLCLDLRTDAKTLRDMKYYQSHK